MAGQRGGWNLNCRPWIFPWALHQANSSAGHAASCSFYYFFLIVHTLITTNTPTHEQQLHQPQPPHWPEKWVTWANNQEQMTGWKCHGTFRSNQQKQDWAWAWAKRLGFRFGRAKKPEAGQATLWLFHLKSLTLKISQFFTTDRIITQHFIS